jgi:hypothetical protein
MILVISNTEGVPSMYLPLGTINVVSMIKDAVEDRKRHKSDAEENDKVYKCFKDNEFKDVKSSTLRVGNLIKVNYLSIYRYLKINMFLQIYWFYKQVTKKDWRILKQKILMEKRMSK